MKNIIRQFTALGCVGWGWVGGGGSYIWHSTDVCVPNGSLFQCCQVYDLPTFFNKKYMTDPIFLDSYVKGSTILTSQYMHTFFFAQRFVKAAVSLGIQ